MHLHSPRADSLNIESARPQRDPVTPRTTRASGRSWPRRTTAYPHCVSGLRITLAGAYVRHASRYWATGPNVHAEQKRPYIWQDRTANADNRLQASLPKWCRVDGTQRRLNFTANGHVGMQSRNLWLEFAPDLDLGVCLTWMAGNARYRFARGECGTAVTRTLGTETTRKARTLVDDLHRRPPRGVFCRGKA